MITLEQAEEIARKSAIAEINKLRVEGLEVGELRFAREGIKVWTFAVPIPKLQDEGYAPEAITISVDKRDGHIWTDEDFEELAKSFEK